MVDSSVGRMGSSTAAIAALVVVSSRGVRVRLVVRLAVAVPKLELAVTGTWFGTKLAGSLTTVPLVSVLGTAIVPETEPRTVGTPRTTGPYTTPLEITAATSLKSVASWMSAGGRPGKALALKVPG